jgi:uroporphyrinogen-III synthase
MQKFRAIILATRSIDEQLIKNASKQNIKIDVIPFIETEAIDTLKVYNEIENALLQTATVVFTSTNAVDAVAVHLHDYNPEWEIYCIGNTTKKLVSEYFGADLIAAAAKDATELAQKIIEDDATDEVIFFCGDKRRDELPALLIQHDIEVNEIEVYQTKMLHHKINGNYDGILFFSPGAVESFFSNNKLDERTVLFAIGNTTANEIKKCCSNRIVISEEPGKKDLIERAMSFFHEN